MVSLITQCKFIDYTEGKEYVFSLDELKNKLKSYITENAANLNGEIEKSIDFDDLEDVIEKINDFYDDDRLLLVTINPSINHLKHCLRVDKIVYLDNETHDTINDNKLIDMVKPVISWVIKIEFYMFILKPGTLLNMTKTTVQNRKQKQMV